MHRGLVAVGCLLVLVCAAAAPPSPLRVGLAVYSGDRSAACFAEGFLTDAAEATGRAIAPGLEKVDLASGDLAPYPMVVFSGEGGFELSEAEKGALRAYIDGGGFLLASAGCSERRWARSFRTLFEELYGEEALQPLSLDHPLFHTVHEIDAVSTGRPLADTTLYGYAVEGRLRVLYSPQGLNDTADAGAMCCCCGGDEIRDASRINANALAYALGG